MAGRASNVHADLADVQAEIASRMQRGQTFARIESELIDPSDFSAEEKAALWLYGWSFVPAASQRTEADAHIRRLATRQRRPSGASYSPA